MHNDDETASNIITPLIAFGIALVVTIISLGLCLLIYWYCRSRYIDDDKDYEYVETYKDNDNLTSVINHNAFIGKTVAQVHQPGNIVPAVPVTDDECIVDVLRSQYNDMKPKLPPKQRPLAMSMSAPEASSLLGEPFATTPLISAVSTNI